MPDHSMPRIKVTRSILCISSFATILFCAFTLWTTADVRNGLHRITGLQLSGKYTSGNPDLSDDIGTGRKPLTLDPVESREMSRMFWSTLNYKPWFLPGGFLRPDDRSDVYRKLAVWPDQDPDSDRIVNQLMYMPAGYKASAASRNKKIHLFYGRGGWNARDLPMGQSKFLRDNCPVNTCELTMDPQDMQSADAIFFKVSGSISSFRLVKLEAGWQESSRWRDCLFTQRAVRDSFCSPRLTQSCDCICFCPGIRAWIRICLFAVCFHDEQKKESAISITLPLPLSPDVSSFPPFPRRHRL